MTTKNRIVAEVGSVLVMILAVLSGCASVDPGLGDELATGDTNTTGEIIVTAPDAPFSLDLATGIRNGDYTWEYVESGDTAFYKLAGAVYAANAKYYEWTTSNGMGSQSNAAYIQSMNLFVPAAYVDGIDADGLLIIGSGEINGFTAETAPIVFENNNAGYLSGLAGEISNHFSDNTEYMTNGFIYANVGSRGRDIAGSPAGIVDLKSGIRFIRLNSELLPGDTEKIVSIGTSGGGAMSSLVGATGNMDEYYSYLYDQGAAGIEFDGTTYTSTITDDVFAAQLFCPIADIENADMAYAWMRYDTGLNGSGNRGYDFSDYQLALQEELSIAYVDYFNGLGLAAADGSALTLDTRRSGSYYEVILGEISDAFNAFVAVEAWHEIAVSEFMGGPSSYPYADMDFDSWMAAMYGDTSAWLEDNGDGTFTVTSLPEFLIGTDLNRNKDIPGFDDLNMSKEGNAFSADPAVHPHFSESIYDVMVSFDDELSQYEGYDSSYLESYANAVDPQTADWVYLYSAMQILADPDQEYDAAKYWRMRNGTADEHTSFSVNYNIGLTLEKYVPGVSVDYALVWNMPHGAREGTTRGTFTQWVNEIAH